MAVGFKVFDEIGEEWIGGGGVGIDDEAAVFRGNVVGDDHASGIGEKAHLAEELERTVLMMMASFSRPWNPSTVEISRDFRASSRARSSRRG